MGAVLAIPGFVISRTPNNLTSTGPGDGRGGRVQISALLLKIWTVGPNGTTLSPNAMQAVAKPSGEKFAPNSVISIPPWIEPDAGMTRVMCGNGFGAGTIGAAGVESVIPDIAMLTFGIICINGLLSRRLSFADMGIDEAKGCSGANGLVSSTLGPASPVAWDGCGENPTDGEDGAVVGRGLSECVYD